MKIKVLIVCSGNVKAGEIFDIRLHHSFIYEQTEELRKKDIEFEYFYITGKGIFGYINNYLRYIKTISSFKPDIVHAHYGLSGLFANLQRKVPVITTFHGSDVFLFRNNLRLSRLANRLSRRSIVVNKNMCALLKKVSKLEVIPCGVDTNRLYAINEKPLSNLPIIVEGKINILFSSRFDYYEKNYPLAKEVIALLGQEYNLIELKGYSREEVNILMNSCDAALMTSISEGSPLFVKEAMACNCPIVATDVGDVLEVIGDTPGCYITSFDKNDIADKLKRAVEFRRQQKQTTGRARIIKSGFDSETVAGKIIEIYNEVLKIKN
jgi:teichuronic acid biosynthesis glycosyltransferase TuaC